MNVVKFGALPVGTDISQKSMQTGCRVGIHGKSQRGIRQSSSPIFSPKVKKWVWALAISSSPLLPGVNICWVSIWICVNIGSESIKTRTGIDKYSSRRKVEQEILIKTSALLQI